MQPMHAALAPRYFVLKKSAKQLPSCGRKCMARTHSGRILLLCKQSAPQSDYPVGSLGLGRPEIRLVFTEGAGRGAPSGAGRLYADPAISLAVALPARWRRALGEAREPLA